MTSTAVRAAWLAAANCAARSPGYREKAEFALTVEEFRLLDEAAGRARLARGAYAAEAALAAAAGTASVGDMTLREALTELSALPGWSGGSG
jgi:hypothetical protein